MVQLVLMSESFEKDVPQPVLFTCIVTINLNIQSTCEIQLSVKGAWCCETVSFWYTKRCPPLIQGKKECYHLWVCKTCAINGLSTTVRRIGDISCIRSWCEGAEPARNTGVVCAIKNGNCITVGGITNSHYWIRISCWWTEEVQLDAEHEVDGWTWWHLSWWGYDKSEKTAVQLTWCEMYFSVSNIGKVWWRAKCVQCSWCQ